MRLPPSRRPTKSAGFTILELMIVVAIVLILTAIGIVQSKEMVPRFRTRRAAKTFAGLVNQCRAMAIQTNRECSVFLVDYDSNLSDLTSNTGAYWVGVGDESSGSTNWDYLPADMLADGGDDDISIGVVDLGDDTNPYYAKHVGMDTWGAGLTGPGTGNSDRIVFDSRGFVINPAADFGADGTIQLTFVNKVARSKGVVEDFTVTISRSGMTRVDNSVNARFDTTTSGTALSSSES
jgi:prepilin-type N-terminal cleavage/methylation domain-containing protein